MSWGRILGIQGKETCHANISLPRSGEWAGMLPVAFGVCLGNTSKVNARYCLGVVLGQVTIAHRASVGGGELLLILNLLFSSLLAKTRESRVEGSNIVLLFIRAGTK